MGLFDLERGRTRLLDILWKETSGVDHPANLEEGWAVMKASEMTLDDLDLDKLSELLDQAGEGDDVRKAAAAADFADAPDDIKDAAKRVAAWQKEKKTKDESTSEPALVRRLLNHLLNQAEKGDGHEKANKSEENLDGSPSEEDLIAEAVAKALPELFEDMRVAKASGDPQVRATIGRGALARFKAAIAANMQERSA